MFIEATTALFLACKGQTVIPFPFPGVNISISRSDITRRMAQYLLTPNAPARSQSITSFGKLKEFNAQSRLPRSDVTHRDIRDIMSFLAAPNTFPLLPQAA